MKMQCRIDGFELVLGLLTKARNDAVIDDEKSDDFKEGFYYGIDTLIQGLTKFKESEEIRNERNENRP